MEKFIITTGKTLDLAIAAALEELKMDRTSVSVEVLEQPKSGFLGFGAQPAKVKVTYEADEEVAVPAAALSSASRSKPKPYVPKSQRTEAPKEAAKPRPEPARQEPPKVEAAEPAKARQEAVPHAVKNGEDAYAVDLVGPSLGLLIGHRGETLDAIQHLANYVINRNASKRIRVNVDAESYRLKREESLQRLAQKVAGKVVRYRRNITLEPMNAYERHVIHAALQDTPDVTTYSTGTEPNRRIVVAYSRYKSTEK